MPRYKLRTLLILLAILPPMLAWWAWPTIDRLLWPPTPAIQTTIAISLDPFGTPLPSAIGNNPFVTPPDDQSGSSVKDGDEDPFRPPGVANKSADPFATP